MLTVKKRRTYDVHVTLTDYPSAKRLSERLFKRSRNGSVRVDSMEVSNLPGETQRAVVSARVRYTAVGNVPYDVRRMVGKVADRAGIDPISVCVSPIGSLERVLSE